jgi:hypothetical protein
VARRTTGTVRDRTYSGLSLTDMLAITSIGDRHGANGGLTTQLTSSLYEVELSKVLEPPFEAM